MYDIIIIGAGPAGLSAALYALRANKKVLVLEAKTYGGQIINAHKVSNYPAISTISGFDFATNLYNQVKDLGCEIKYETVINVSEDKKVTTNLNTYNAKAIIIATGVENRKLNIKNEQEFIGKGVSYCATCDGNFYKDLTVAVVGGGNTAVEDALYLADIASKVYLIHRREEFRAENIYLDKIKEKDNIELVLNSQIVEINGANKLENIKINTNNQEKIISISGLFIAVGQEPKNEIFSNVVDIDEKGYFISKDGVHTKTKKIYIAGDARQKDLRQLTTAVSDGAIAATMAIKEIN